jgi:hypothetical protein
MRFGTQYKNEDQTVSADKDEVRIRGFRDGDNRVRFLEEINDWTGYWEHYDPSLAARGAYFPCTGNRNTCPGCVSENERTRRASKRYLVNCLSNGYVNVYKIPVSLLDRMIRRSDADDGSIRARDYVIIKSGKGTDTEYDVEKEERSKVDFAQYTGQLIDHQQILQESYIHAIGSPPDDEDENMANQERPAPRPPVREEPARPVRTVRAEERPAKVEAPVRRMTVPDVPPSEPQQEQVAAEEETVLSEEEVRAMGAIELLRLYDQCGITPPDTASAPALAEFLIEKLQG